MIYTVKRHLLCNCCVEIETWFNSKYNSIEV